MKPDDALVIYVAPLGSSLNLARDDANCSDCPPAVVYQGDHGDAGARRLRNCRLRHPQRERSTGPQAAN